MSNAQNATNAAAQAKKAAAAAKRAETIAAKKAAAEAAEAEAQANAEAEANAEAARAAEAAAAAKAEAEAEAEAEANASAPTDREKAESAQSVLLAAIETRIEYAPNANFAKNMRAEHNALCGRSALLAIEKCMTLEVDFIALAKCYAITDKSAHDYIAIYAAQKVRRAVFALACGMTSQFDTYTQAILRNLIKLESLSNRGSQIALSNKVVFTEDMQTQAVRSFKMCEPSTASTQASSTRQMLRFLNVCNVVKSRKDDSITLTDSAAAAKVKSMFE